jgi:flagellar hook-associated protein 2
MLDSSNGLITNKQNALTSEQDGLIEERAELDARMEAREALISAQFLYNDALVSTLNSTADFITQQFEAMNSDS